MKGLRIYKIISYILLPVGALMGLVAVFSLLLALGNLGILFAVFLVGSTAIYIFTSFYFFQNAIERKRLLKHTLKDWIKVNAYVAMFVCISGIFQGIYLLFNPSILEGQIEAMESMAPAPGFGANQATIMKYLEVVQYGMLVIFAILYYHVITTLRLIKQFQSMFGK